MTASSRPAALIGAIAAGAALGTGELLSGLSSRVPSLVVGVADLIVDNAPGGAVETSIDTFGSDQKGLLVAGIVVLALAIGASFGQLAAIRFPVGAAGFVAFGIFGGWAAARTSLASPGGAWISAALSIATGLAVLTTLQPRPEPEPAPAPMTMGPDRRRFLLVGSAAAAWGVFGGGIGHLLRNARNVDAARRELAAALGPRPGPLVPAGVTAFDDTITGISELVTPAASFYRVDTAIVVPQVGTDGWTLKVKGMVDREIELTFDDLLAMHREEHFVTLQCVSNRVGGSLVGNALWSGVPLRDVLDKAGVHPEATQLVGRSIDGWTGGFPTAAAYDGRSSMVAITMNGEPLPTEHGFPARLIIPGLYGYVSATKWLTELELTTYDAFDGYWVPRGWAKDGPIKTESRIDVPHSGAKVAAGPTAIAGVAWAPTRGISRVEVRVDDGEWIAATLAGVLSDESWVQWVVDWEATPGQHRLQVRATDGAGVAQTSEIAPPAPSGATGYHTITITVR